VSRRVADLFNREHCVLVGRATTGLKLIFDALSINGEVVYPAYTCPSPVYAALYSGATPTFCDVGDDYNMHPGSLSDSITDETEAVVPIHMFGHPVRMDEIEEICGDDVLLIEDTCQAVCSEYGGTETGSWGDISVVSFGDKKPIDAGSGGAVLTDDGDVASRLRGAEEEVPIRDKKRLERLYDYYREIYYSIEDFKKMKPEAEKLFQAFPEVFEELYIRGFEEYLIPEINSTFDSLEQDIEERKKNARGYRESIDLPEVTHPDPLGMPVYYRYSLMLKTPELRDSVVSYLRERDFHVSTLYDTIHRRFGVTSEFPNAEYLSERTVNLWVHGVDSEYVENCSEAVEEAVEEARG
jgi:dTDP-4-amino-4,6-dideoxygalactose transaminase